MTPSCRVSTRCIVDVRSYSSLLGVTDVAAVIDTVLAMDPRSLETHLEMLQTSDDRLAAWVVVDLAVHCRDPLAPLATLCRDALRAADDLDHLLHRPRCYDIEAVCRAGRANAIFNLTEATRKQVDPQGACRERIRRIHPRLKIAAVTESFRHEAEIGRIRAARQAAQPDLWRLLADAAARPPAGLHSPAAVAPRQPSFPPTHQIHRLWLWLRALVSEFHEVHDD